MRLTGDDFMPGYFLTMQKIFAKENLEHCLEFWRYPQIRDIGLEEGAQEPTPLSTLLHFFPSPPVPSL